MLQQVDLVRHLLFLKIPDGFFLGPALLFKDQVQFRDAAHLVLDPDNILAVQLDAGQADKHAVAHGILNANPLIRIKMTKGQQHHKAQGTLVNAAAFLVFQRQGSQSTVLAKHVIELADHAAGLGCQGAAGKRAKRFQASLDSGAFREFFFVVH